MRGRGAGRLGWPASDRPRGPPEPLRPAGATGDRAAASSLCWYHCRSYFEHETADMLELNPVRQRITDLTDRVVSLRGYL